MRKNAVSIPVNNFGSESGAGISIERIFFESLPDLGDWEQPERHDRHSFFLLEKGSVTMEIDFQKYDIRSPSIIYMHPDQVHRIIAFEQVTVSAWAITNENLNPEYLRLLEEITPAVPIPLNKDAFSLMVEASSFCIRFAKRKNAPLFHSLFKDSCNMLIGLVIIPYIEQSKPADKLSRFEIITKAFKSALERDFTTIKSPAGYAQKLNLSAPYLNECVRNATGYPVSHHIQQRVILEARRLLYHSGRSVKEIAAELGYDDYPYFSRLFTKVAGLPPSAFRHKNRD